MSSTVTYLFLLKEDKNVCFVQKCHLEQMPDTELRKMNINYQKFVELWLIFTNVSVLPRSYIKKSFFCRPKNTAD